MTRSPAWTWTAGSGYSGGRHGPGGNMVEMAGGMNFGLIDWVGGHLNGVITSVQ